MLEIVASKRKFVFNIRTGPVERNKGSDGYCAKLKREETLKLNYWMRSAVKERSMSLLIP